MAIVEFQDWARKKISYKVEIFLEQREVAFLSPSKIISTLTHALAS